jgi:hypothetical protein
MYGIRLKDVASWKRVVVLLIMGEEKSKGRARVQWALGIRLS